jgi:hypothetical protein
MNEWMDDWFGLLKGAAEESNRTVIFFEKRTENFFVTN